MVRGLLFLCSGRAVLALLCLFPLVHAAEAAVCAARATLIESIQSKRLHQVEGLGLAGGKLVELWVSQGVPNAWLITITTADETSCILAAGSTWAVRPPTVRLQEREG